MQVNADALELERGFEGIFLLSFFLLTKMTECIYGSVVKIRDFIVKVVSPVFFPWLHLLAPWKPSSLQEFECPCADDAEGGSGCTWEGLFLLLGQQRLPGLWWFISQKKNVIRINRCFLCLKVFFNLFFKHLAYCIYFDVSQIASLKRYQSFCQLLMLLPFSSSSWQSTIKVVFCYDLQ